MIPENQPFIDMLTRKYLMPDPDPVPNSHTNGHATALSDEEIVAKCREARNAAKFASLFDDGDTSAHGHDDSRADLALAALLAFYSDDAAQLDRLMSASALGRRPKWRNRLDYRRRTIDHALRNRGERYTPGSSERSLPFPFPNREETRNDPPKKPAIVRFSEMGAPEPRRYLIDGLIPEAHPTVLYGDGGVAKSMLALSASLAVARGTHWLGRTATQGGVLFADFELDAQEQQRRVNQLTRAEGLSRPPENLLYMSALGYPTRAAFAAALDECKTRGVKLLVLDSLGPALQGDAEAARDVIGFYQNVLEPFRAAGITVLIVDHQSKLQAGERYQNKRAFGSVFKGNLARSVIQVEARDRWENKLALRLRQTKHNFGTLADPFGVELGFSEEMVAVQHIELEASAMAEENTLNATDRVCHALKDGPAYPEDLVESTGLAVATVKKTLSQLRKTGAVEPSGERRKWGAEQVRLSFPEHKGNGNGNDLDDEGSATLRGHEFTEDQERQYRKLIREGMAPGWARKTILASDHPLSCNCEVCI
jgi:hypothetical protein